MQRPKQKVTWSWGSFLWKGSWCLSHSDCVNVWCDHVNQRSSAFQDQDKIHQLTVKLTPISHFSILFGCLDAVYFAVCLGGELVITGAACDALMTVAIAPHQASSSWTLLMAYFLAYFLAYAWHMHGIHTLCNMPWTIHSQHDLRSGTQWADAADAADAVRLVACPACPGLWSSRHTLPAQFHGNSCDRWVRIVSLGQNSAKKHGKEAEADDKGPMRDGKIAWQCWSMLINADQCWHEDTRRNCWTALICFFRMFSIFSAEANFAFLAMASWLIFHSCASWI